MTLIKCLILTGILLISASNMARIGAAFGLITITSYPAFQWFEVGSLVCFILVEGFIAHDASKSLALLSQKKRSRLETFIFRFQSVGLIFLGIVFPTVGGVVWVSMTGSHWLNLLWTIPILACVPVAVALHGMSDIILPKVISKPNKSVREQIIVDVVQNGRSPIDIADKHNVSVEQIEIIQDEIKQRLG